MISKSEYENAVKRSIAAFEDAGIVLTEKERSSIEVADFGLSDLQNIGLQILTYINTERVCAKEMVLFPRQTCPEHIHADGDGYQGKEETFRCRRGEVFLYVDGERTQPILGVLPPTTVTVFHEVHLKEGEQYTLYPNTRHWFQAGESGAVISEFSTRSRDESDIFTDTRITRAPEVEA